ncbi:hypothetical protein MTR67_021674 [Solanum verrucosum]|uniref:Uncharacterized protein n=1 Tax=Solanum verrucosum TaxID=315347 RepID=A0AAF0QQH2_SOLVR|nr:hypothetical protein MTR67_021674 [Solanum verrucosum]
MDWLLVSKLQLEECNMITEAGFFGIDLNCGKKLKTLSLVICFGVKHLNYAFPLESLVIRNCPGVGNVTIVVSCETNLVAVNLSGCVNITDKLAELHGGSLESLIIDGCRHVTDATFSSNFKLLLVT